MSKKKSDTNGHAEMAALDVAAVPAEGFDDLRFEPTAEEVEEENIEELIRGVAGSKHQFSLTRRIKGSAKFSNLGKFPANTFDIDHIKDEFGGGEYYVQVTNESGRFTRRFEFIIDDIFKGRESQPIKPNDTLALAQAVAALSKPVEDQSPMMLGLMEKQSAQSKEFMMLMMQMQGESTKMMVGMMTAMMSKPEPSKSDDFSSAITPVLIKMIESSNQKSSGGLDIKSLIELREFLTPEREEKQPTSILDTILAAAPALIPAIAPMLAGGMKRLMPQPSENMPSGFQELPSGVVPSSIPSAQINEAVPPCPLPPDGIPQSAPAVSPFKFELLPLLKRGAEANTDPESYAFVVADMVGEKQMPELLVVLNHLEWAKIFQGFTPDEMEWVASWRDCVLHLDDEDEGEKVAAIAILEKPKTPDASPNKANTAVKPA
jgi:hypothetical protein